MKEQYIITIIAFSHQDVFNSPDLAHGGIEGKSGDDRTPHADISQRMLTA